MNLLVCGIVNKQTRQNKNTYREQIDGYREERGWREDETDTEGQLCGDKWRLTFDGKYTAGHTKAKVECCAQETDIML